MDRRRMNGRRMDEKGWIREVSLGEGWIAEDG